MSERKQKSTSELSTGRKIALLGVGGAALVGFGARINATFDNDRVFHTGPAATAEPAKTPEKPAETVTIVAQSGDSPWSIARHYVKKDQDIRPLVDKIEAAADSDGHPGLQAGEEVVFKP